MSSDDFTSLDEEVSRRLESYLTLGIIGVDTQVYDFRPVTDLLIEMVTACGTEVSEDEIIPEAPVFVGGLPPGKSSLMFIQGRKTSGYGAVFFKFEGEYVDCWIADSLLMLRDAESTDSIFDETRKQMESDPSFAKKLRDRIPDFDHQWERATQGMADLENDHVRLKIGEVPDPSLGSIGITMAYFVSAACEFMATPIAGMKPSQPPRAFRKRMEKKFGVPKITTVDLRRRSGQSYARGASSDIVNHRCLHFVGGFWRRPRGYKTMALGSVTRKWIEGFWRGDPEYGVNLHRYLAKSQRDKEKGTDDEDEGHFKNVTQV